MKRSRIALLSRVHDVVMGNQRGSQGEEGWAKGSYRSPQWDNQGRKRVHVCLNSALHAAERDVYGVIKGEDSGPLQTTEAAEAQGILAEAIVDWAHEHGVALNSMTYEPVFDPKDPNYEPSHIHSLIVEFNDYGHDRYGASTKASDMDDVLSRAEKLSFERWVEEHPDYMTAQQVDQSFIDFVASAS